MGRDIPSFIDDKYEPPWEVPNKPQVEAILNQVKNLSSDEMYTYFQTLFERMTPQAKIAMSEIM